MGRPQKALPTSADKETNISLLKCWNLVQCLSHDLWHQWRTSYLQILQAQEKWRMSSPNIQTGGVVVLKDETLLQRTWPLALVMNYPEQDGLVRVVDVCCKGKVYKCPITRLVKLVSSDNTNSPALPPEASDKNQRLNFKELSSFHFNMLYIFTTIAHGSRYECRVQVLHSCAVLLPPIFTCHARCLPSVSHCL